VDLGPNRIEPADLAGPAGPYSGPQRQPPTRFNSEPTVRNAEFKPGWYPDPLIPAVHPLTGKPLSGARFTAMPFDLPANETHGFWVDLYVPADAKPGLYRGTYRVTWSGAAPVGRISNPSKKPVGRISNPSREERRITNPSYEERRITNPSYDLPVSIQVWDFALQKVPTLVTAFGSPAGRMSYYRHFPDAGPSQRSVGRGGTQCGSCL
jgi:hypothetical protein